jgi:N4-gp56 family major capsid protein
MSKTLIGVNDPKAVKRWAGLLAYDTSQKSFFGSKFMSRDPESNAPIQIETDLESDAGDQITYDLLTELKMLPVEGESNFKGKEESQKFYTDAIWIDQARCGVNTGGKMTRKRTLNNLRAKAKRQQSSWWARLQDELLFIYLSGTRGDNPNFIMPSGFTGRAGNLIVPPDSNHLMYGGYSGLATAFNNITPVDKISNRVIDRAKVRAVTQGGPTGIPYMQPCKIDGDETYVCVMHTFQEDDLRADTTTANWLDIQKAAAAYEGRNSPLFKECLGMYNGVILHSAKNAIRFNNAGATGKVEAARALFMGAHAGIVAFGSPGTNLRYSWHEETRDDGDKVVISSSAIFGCKKVTVNTDVGPQDLGVFALDTAAAIR